MYADVPHQSLPSTELVIKACQWFSDSILTEKWMQLGVSRSSVDSPAHLMLDKELRHHLTPEEADDLRSETMAGTSRGSSGRGRSTANVRDVLNAHNTAQPLDETLNDRVLGRSGGRLGSMKANCPAE